MIFSLSQLKLRLKNNHRIIIQDNQRPVVKANVHFDLPNVEEEEQIIYDEDGVDLEKVKKWLVNVHEQQIIYVEDGVDFEKVKKWLDSGVDPDMLIIKRSESNVEYNFALLLLVAEKGDVDLAKLLLAHGAFVNQKDEKYERTALHWATMAEGKQMVEFLCENAEVNTNSKDFNGCTALHYAAFNGQTEVIKTLLKHNADVNAKDAIGRTPLALVAIFKVVVEAARLLLRSGADINIADDDGFSPLHCAVDDEQSHGELVKLLLEYGADVNAANKDGCAPLAFAITRHGHIENVRLLLRSGADINKADYEGWTPLHCAVDEKQPRVEVIKLLLEYDADVNTANKEGNSPLSYATKYGHIEIVRLLLCSGADINMADDDGWTPLHCAVADEQPRGELVKLLLDNGADVDAINKKGYSPLAFAICRENVENVNLLLRFGADVDLIKKEAYGENYFHYAVRYSRRDIVPILLKHVLEKRGGKGMTAFLNAVTKQGITAFQLAKQNRDKGMPNLQQEYGEMDLRLREKIQRKKKKLAKKINEKKEKLLEKIGRQEKMQERDKLISERKRALAQLDEMICSAGNDPNATYTDPIDGELTLLIGAAIMGNVTAAKQLLEKGACIDSRMGILPATALHYAVMSGQFEMVKLLCECQTDLEARTVDGFRPLMVAVYNKQTEIAKYLLKCGANVFTRSREGLTALHVAVEYSNRENVSILLEHALEKHGEEGRRELLNAEDRNGKTAFHAAQKKGDRKIVESILGSSREETTK